VNIELLYSRLNELVPGYQFSSIEITTLFDSITNDLINLDDIESSSIDVFQIISDSGERPQLTIEDVRLYLIRSVLGGNSIMEHIDTNNTINNQTIEQTQPTKFDIDRASNGSVVLNIDSSKNTTQKLYMTNINVVYDLQSIKNVINTDIIELKSNVKPYTPDLNLQIKNLMITIADLKSSLQSKDEELIQNKNIVSELTETIKSLEDNYDSVVDQITNGNTDQLTNVQNSINDIAVKLAMNESLDSLQQLQLDAIPQLIKSAIENSKGNKDIDNSDETDTFDDSVDDDINFGESG